MHDLEGGTNHQGRGGERENIITIQQGRICRYCRRRML